ncbi:MAG: hypothetical protein JO307_26765 [Bryobacterales bacterium]|nr:hypothetical protein [Bryobacterales bacterium]
MTYQQLYLAVGVPILVNILFNGILIRLVWSALDRRITQESARLKHLEEKER